MEILICVKQVPDTSEIKFDPVTHTLLREAATGVINPYDLYALELALKLKESKGGRVTVLSMGPPQAVSILQDCLARGADSAYLISDRQLAGSDTLSTSFTLSRAILKIAAVNAAGSFDVIFCGRQSTDGDTAQVGPQIAEWLDLPQMTYAVDIQTNDDILTIKRDVYEGCTVMACHMPCLITVSKLPYGVRYPTMKGKIAAMAVKIPILSLDDLPDIEKDRIGLAGSPTCVRKTYLPAHQSKGILIKASSIQESAAALTDLLYRDNVI